MKITSNFSGIRSSAQWSRRFLLSMSLLLAGWGCANDDDDLVPPEVANDDDDAQPPCESCVDPEIIEEAGFELSCFWNAEKVEPAGLWPVLKSIVHPCSHFPILGWSVSKADPTGKTLRIAARELDEDGNFLVDSQYQMRFKPIDFTANPHFKAELDGPTPAVDLGGGFMIEDAFYEGVFASDYRSIENISFQGIIDPQSAMDVLGTDPCDLTPGICAEDGLIHIRIEELSAQRIDATLPAPVSVTDLAGTLYRLKVPLEGGMMKLRSEIQRLSDRSLNLSLDLEIYVAGPGAEPDSLEMRLGTTGSDFQNESEPMRLESVEFRANPYFKASWYEIESVISPFETFPVEEAWLAGYFNEDLSGIDAIILYMKINASLLEPQVGSDPCDVIPGICTPNGMIVSRTEGLHAVRVGGGVGFWVYGRATARRALTTDGRFGILDDYRYPYVYTLTNNSPPGFGRLR